MEDAESKTRNIQRKLGKVDALAYNQEEIVIPDDEGEE